MKNFEWKQVNWLDADGKIVFDDSIGFVQVRKALFSFRLKQSSDYSAGPTRLTGGYMHPDYRGLAADSLSKFLYIGESGEEATLNPHNILEIFSKDIYRSRPSEKLDIQSLIIQKIFHRGASRYSEESVSIEVNRENLSSNPLQSLQVWICEEIQNMNDGELKGLYQRPLFSDLQIGKSVFHNTLRKCTVVKIYEQPDIADRMIDIQSANQKITTIKFGDYASNPIYKLPYLSPIIDEAEQFNVCKNELLLSPFTLSGDKAINVYWQQIPNAARYTISIYKRDNRPYLQQIYPLKDYIVERGEGFLAIKDLLGSDYVAVVKAEDRSGEIIAQSRGIVVISGNKSYPRFWE